MPVFIDILSVMAETKEAKLKALNMFFRGDYKEDDFPDKVLNLLYKNEVKSRLDAMNINLQMTPREHDVIFGKALHPEVIVRDQTSPTDKNYKTFLNFINDMLYAINEIPVSLLSDVRNIQREGILSTSADKVLCNHLPHLVEAFGKETLEFKYRNQRKHYILGVIRKICNILGFEFSSKRMNTHQNGKRVYITLYTIS